MINQDFLKQITVLYIEDDSHIRNSMETLFKKMFKNIIIGINGEDGYKKFIENQSLIDIIISDISMPILNGIEMTALVREIDPYIPIIFTTAHSDAEFFLEAINHNIFHYAIKPINLKQLMIAVQDATKKQLDSKIIKAKELENSRYIEMINQIALVFKTDLEGKITYTNQILVEISGFLEEELLQLHHYDLLDKNISHSILETMQDTLKGGNIWKGKLKNCSKNGESYIENVTIIPIFDIFGEKIVEFMSVGFLVTEDENAKREFQIKVIQKIKEQKETEIQLLEKIKNLEFKLSLGENIDILFYNLETEKKKNEQLLLQINHYEQLLNEKERNEKELINKLLTKENDLFEYKKLITKKLEIAKQESLHDKNIIKIQYEETLRLNAYLKENNTKITNLYDVILHREDEIATLLKDKIDTSRSK